MFARLRISQCRGPLFLVGVAGFRVFGKAHKTYEMSTSPAFTEGPPGHVWHPGLDSVGKMNIAISIFERGFGVPIWGASFVTGPC